MKKPPKRTIPDLSKKPQASKSGLAGDKLWLEFSAKLTPLTNRDRCVDLSSNTCFTAKKTPGELSVGVRAIPREQSKQAHVKLPNFSHGTAAGLDRQSARKMRRGKIEVQGSLDLHGMIQIEAHKSLLGFLEHAYVVGKKSVLVITGKGLSQSGEIGVLRQAVPRWLNEQPMKNWIRGFNYAAPTDGGEGALYVLLRRKR